jgi:hypothetical protein
MATITKIPVTTTKTRAAPDRHIEARARRRTNHKQATMPSGIGSETKKVICRLTAEPD